MSDISIQFPDWLAAIPVGFALLVSALWLTPVLLWKWPRGEGRRLLPLLFGAIPWAVLYPAIIIGAINLRTPDAVARLLGAVMVLATLLAAIALLARSPNDRWIAGAIGAANILVALCCEAAVLLIF